MISLAMLVRPLFSRLRALSIGALRLVRRLRGVALSPLPDGAGHCDAPRHREAPAQRDGSVVGIAFPGRLVGQIDGFVVARGRRGDLRAGVAQDLVRFWRTRCRPRGRSPPSTPARLVITGAIRRRELCSRIGATASRPLLGQPLLPRPPRRRVSLLPDPLEQDSVLLVARGELRGGGTRVRAPSGTRRARELLFRIVGEFRRGSPRAHPRLSPLLDSAPARPETVRASSGPDRSRVRGWRAPGACSGLPPVSADSADFACSPASAARCSAIARRFASRVEAGDFSGGHLVRNLRVKRSKGR